MVERIKKKKNDVKSSEQKKGEETPFLSSDILNPEFLLPSEIYHSRLSVKNGILELYVI